MTVYLCHACGWIQGEEEDDLHCARCGASRAMIERVQVERIPKNKWQKALKL